jgi:hypothetical protein
MLDCAVLKTNALSFKEKLKVAYELMVELSENPSSTGDNNY